MSEGGSGACGAGAPGSASQLAAAGSGGAETSSSNAGGDDAPSAPAPPAAPAPTPAASPAPASAETVPSQMAASTQTVAPPPDRGPRSQILSPLVRRLASEHGVDLGQVSGTGTGGRITKNDVLGFVAAHGETAPVTSTPSPAAQPAPAAAPAAQPAPAAAQAPPAVVGGGEETVPVSHIR